MINILLTNSSSETSEGNHISETTLESLSLISKIIENSFYFHVLGENKF